MRETCICQREAVKHVLEVKKYEHIGKNIAHTGVRTIHSSGIHWGSWNTSPVGNFTVCIHWDTKTLLSTHSVPATSDTGKRDELVEKYKKDWGHGFKE